MFVIAAIAFLLAQLSQAVQQGDSSSDDVASGPYVTVERMDSKRILLRVPNGAPLPDADDEVMLEELENWKWRVEFSAAGAAVLVTSSQCPHGLGLLPSALGWQGGGHWREWRGMFEHAKGALTTEVVQGWTVLSSSKACEKAQGVKELGTQVGISEKTCLEMCEAKEDCNAVDYYRVTKWCNFHDKPCTDPRKEHDGASSWALRRGAKAVEKHGGDVIKSAVLTFFEAKAWCQQVPECAGFSYEGAWPDKEREGGVPRSVLFTSRQQLHTTGVFSKWQSYLLKDNPRAYCNPEGAQFECPHNPYACLGLSIDADDSAVKQAYRGLSKRMHPDKISVHRRTPEAVKQAEEAFRDISEAHEILRDPERRREADGRMKRARKEWEANKASLQDLYIKEPLVASLEPESYPVLLPKGQEWLVHFFMPTNDDCKQMKIAIARAAAELGNGEDERVAAPDEDSEARPPAEARFIPGDVFRGTIREGSDALRLEGASSREGDTFMALVVKSDNAAEFHIPGEHFDVRLARLEATSALKDSRFSFRIIGPARTLSGSFDSNLAAFRGTIVENAKKGKDIASFTMSRDTWRPPSPMTSQDDSSTATSQAEDDDEEDTAAEQGRQRPRLFGAVNCGRFPDFCKRKGANPDKTRFPQVRMLFPEETRFESYRGRIVGKDIVAFAREASRPQGEVQQLDAETLAEVEAGPKQPWVVLLVQGEPSKKECELCRIALPMLRRSAMRLLDAGVGVAWVNCSEDALCRRLVPDGSFDAEWGSLRWVELGGGAAPPGISTTKSGVLWDSSLVFGEIGQQWLLSSLEAASRTAEFLYQVSPRDKPVAAARVSSSSRRKGRKRRRRKRSEL